MLPKISISRQSQSREARQLTGGIFFLKNPAWNGFASKSRRHWQASCGRSTRLDSMNERRGGVRRKKTIVNATCSFAALFFLTTAASAQCAQSPTVLRAPQGQRAKFITACTNANGKMHGVCDKVPTCTQPIPRMSSSGRSQTPRSASMPAGRLQGIGLTAILTPDTTPRSRARSIRRTIALCCTPRRDRSSRLGRARRRCSQFQ
jgi:hypothetical protein